MPWARGVLSGTLGGSAKIWLVFKPGPIELDRAKIGVAQWAELGEVVALGKAMARA